MKKSRYTDEQIAFALRQAETGTPVQEVIRKMGIAEQTFYNWKKHYGGLGPMLSSESWIFKWRNRDKRVHLFLN
jgi:transposase-like protein